MLFTRHVSNRLAAYLDGQLPASEKRQIDHHLAGCARCSAEREVVAAGMLAVEQLSLVEAPEEIWLAIDAASERRAAPRWGWLWAVTATALFALAAGAYWGVRQEFQRDVTALAGAPRIDGNWIETDTDSRAAVRVGTIGSVEMAPNTRLQVISGRAGEHRMALARGEIRALILAPPRQFFVETASGTAVDLGCEYTLRADEEGSGVLEVTKGWVSFEWKGMESLVPAGASCRTRPREGPGIPVFTDATQAFREALENQDLEAILSQARVRDTLTLWHLLGRTPIGNRARVFDRIASLTPLPAGVSREKALALDRTTLKLWLDELAWTW